MSVPIDSSLFSAKCMRALAAAGIMDIETLSSRTRLELLRIDGVGPRTITFIARLLSRHGKSLRGEVQKSMGSDPLQQAFERVLCFHVANDLAQEIAADLIGEVKHYRKGLSARKSGSRFQHAV